MNRTPRIAGTGPLTFSSCTDVARPSDFATLDVNGYYWSLGMRGWLGPVSARDVRRHFRSPEQWSSPWMTYVVTRLLDHSFRADYNRSTRMVMDDYIEAANRRMMNDVVVDQRRRGRTESDIDQMFSRLNDLIQQAEDKESDPLDFLPPIHKDHGDGSGRTFPYSYWLWGDSEPSPEALSQWQRTVVSSLQRRGIKVEVTLGWGTFLPWDVEYNSVTGSYVVVCNHEGPSAIASDEAVTLIAEHQQQLNPHS